jgi:hypothetical protein
VRSLHGRGIGEPRSRGASARPRAILDATTGWEFARRASSEAVADKAVHAIPSHGEEGLVGSSLYSLPGRRLLRVIGSSLVLVAAAACGQSEPSSSAPSATSSLIAPPMSSSHPVSTSGLKPRASLPPLVEGEADACLPLCAAGLVRPGPIPAGKYQTLWFFGGYMTVELDGSWTGIEDSTGEFKLAPSEDTEYGFSFALDLYPVSDGERVEDVPLTAQGLEDWLRQNPDLIVADAEGGDVGGIPTSVLDIRLSDEATAEHADCPAPCVDFLGFEQWDHANGILGDDVYRFYLADLQYSGSDHVLVVTIEGRDQEDLDAFGSIVEPLLPTVTVPAHAP